MAFQIGAQHYLHLAYTGITAPQSINRLLDAAGDPVGAGGLSAKDVVLVPHDLIKDVDVGGSNNKEDVTTRQTARQGYSANLITTTDGTMTVQFAYEPRDDAGVYTRNDLAILQYCFATKKTIFAVDLDKPLDEAGVGGAQGTAANWSIGISKAKPVQGQVVMDVEFAIESYPQDIFTLDGTQAGFRSIS